MLMRMLFLCLGWMAMEVILVLLIIVFAEEC